MIEDTEKWEKEDFEYGKDSARYMPINYSTWGEWVLYDKFLCRPNYCYNCKSDNTFHKRQQKLGDNVANIWRVEIDEAGKCKILKKWDFCLNCGKEILFEYFIFIK